MITVSPSGHDDTAQLQAADAQGQGVSFAPGTYQVSPGLRQTTPWIGADRSLVTLKAAASTWVFGTPLVAVANGVLLSGISFDVSAAIIPNQFNYPVLNCAGSGWRVRDCAFLGLKTLMLGIYGANITDFEISRNLFVMPVPTNQLNQAINLGPATRGVISFNECNGTGMDLGGTDLSVSDNIVYNWAFGGGITVMPNVGNSNFKITNNLCYGSVGVDVNNTRPAGVEFWGSGSVIANNLCHGNSGFGITVGGPNNVVSNNSCIGNGTSPGASAGIIMYSIPGTAATGNAVSGNVCTGAPQNYGIFLDAQGAPITGNSYTGNNLMGNTSGASNVILT